MIDASLGSLPRLVHEELERDLWRWLSASARECGWRSEILPEEVLGLSNDDFWLQADLQWLQSAAMRVFGAELLVTLKAMRRVSRSDITQSQRVTGPIDWPRTIALRATAGWSPTYFAVVEPKTDEAPSELGTIRWVAEQAHNAAVACLDRLQARRDSERQPASSADLGDYLNMVVRNTAAIIAHPCMREIVAPARPSQRVIRLMSVSRVPVFRIAAELAFLRGSLSDRNCPTALAHSIAHNVREPANLSTSFELWALFRILKVLGESSIQQCPTRLLRPGRQGAIATFRRGEARIDVYYQSLPEPLSESSRFGAILEANGLSRSSRRPDIIVTATTKWSELALIVELKASSDASYISDGTYKVFGYLADFETALSKSTVVPKGLLVAARCENARGADAGDAEVWICDAVGFENDFRRYVHRVLNPWLDREQHAPVAVNG